MASLLNDLRSGTILYSLCSFTIMAVYSDRRDSYEFLNSIYQPALMAIVSESMPSEKRRMGFGTIMLITSTSITLGPLVAALPYNQFGLEQGTRAKYALVVALFLAAAILRFRLKEIFIETQRPSWKEFFRSYSTSLKKRVNVWKRVHDQCFTCFSAVQS